MNDTHPGESIFNQTYNPGSFGEKRFQDLELTEPDFYQLQKILKKALENIDEEKLYTKHIFDRFDPQALLTTIVRKGTYISTIIGLTYIFKCMQKNHFL